MLSHDADLVIGAGDFGNVRRGLDISFDILKHIDKPFVTVPGNSESFEELEAICEGSPNIYVLHGSGLKLNDLFIYGIGGGIPVTPFGSWSYDFTEEEAESLLAGLPENAILVSHSPPKGVLDRSGSGRSIGSTAVRKAVIEKKPILCICGHVHACGGKSAVLGETEVINAGPKGFVLTI